MTATVPVPVGFAHQMNGWFRRGPEQGGAFQWVQDPPGDSLQPEAIGAVMEVTKWLKPSNSGHDLVTARVCRPQREWLRRETGKDYVVKVHCDEEVAIHVAPDPCAGVREGVGKASVGERIGQPLSRESVSNPGADVVHSTGGKIGGRVLESARGTRRGLGPRAVRA